MIVIATGLIPLPPLSIVSTTVMWETSRLLGRNIVHSTGKKLRITKCAGRRDTVENGAKHHYCIKPALLVRYKHVLTGRNRESKGENVY